MLGNMLLTNVDRKCNQHGAGLYLKFANGIVNTHVINDVTLVVNLALEIFNFLPN